MVLDILGYLKFSHAAKFYSKNNIEYLLHLCFHFAFIFLLSLYFLIYFLLNVMI